MEHFKVNFNRTNFSRCPEVQLDLSTLVKLVNFWVKFCLPVFCFVLFYKCYHFQGRNQCQAQCWDIAMAIIKWILNIVSQNANLSLCQVPPSPIGTRSFTPMHTLEMSNRGRAGRSGFRLGSLEENHSLGKSKWDEICPSFLLLHAQSMSWESSAPQYQVGSEMLNTAPNWQNENFSKEWELHSLKPAPALLLVLCFWIRN